MRSFLVGFFRTLNNLLQSPQKVIWLCLTVIIINVVFGGSLFRLWSLYHDYNGLQTKISQLQIQNQNLKLNLKRAKDPAFMEREARDRFDLVNEGDLVFVFSDEGAK